jgi:para-nitrobenzyl esterase
MLLGSNQDEVRYWIKSMDYYTRFISGEIIYKLGFPILFETDLKRMSLEDKQNVYDFKKIQSGEKIWKIAEFYTEAVFRIPMNKQAEYHSDAGGNTYVYYWNYPGKNKIMGACHWVELPYTLNNLNESQVVGDEANIDLANEVQDMWINFVRNGNPSTTKYTWEKYNSDTRKTMILGEEIKMEEDYKSEQRELIEPLLKYYMNGNYSDTRGGTHYKGFIVCYGVGSSSNSTTVSQCTIQNITLTDKMSTDVPQPPYTLDEKDDNVYGIQK